MVNRVQKISGVYFSDHAQSRDLLDYQRMKQLQDKITDLEGQVFWDEKHGNYQILVDGLAPHSNSNSTKKNRACSP